MQSHKGDTSGKLEETERNLHRPDLYLLWRIYSILGISPRHTGLPGQAFCTACSVSVNTNRIDSVKPSLL